MKRLDNDMGNFANRLKSFAYLLANTGLAKIEGFQTAVNVTNIERVKGCGWRGGWRRGTEKD
jgi:hypothetical protein